MHSLLITAIVAVVISIMLYLFRRKSSYSNKKDDPQQYMALSKVPTRPEVDVPKSGPELKPKTLPPIKPESAGPIPENEMMQTPPEPAPGPQ